MIAEHDLARYATSAADTRGRRHDEPAARERSPFQRDRDRIIHSTAFRRLMYKTQVFVYHEGDHYRTRMTHSLEVAQIARSIARALRLNEDLAEALALAHDLGHTPFGHAGEDALDAAMAPYGGFDHNAQTLRILTRLERRYAEFDGLNLTWETLEGVVKHNGPLVGADGDLSGVPAAIVAHQQVMDLELQTFAGAEAQAAALSDDIAYNNHDIDDGLRARLFAIEDLLELPGVGEVFHDVAARYPGIDESRLVHESMRRLIDRMVGDVLSESRARLDDAKPDSVAAVRGAARPLIGFSAESRELDLAVRDFLMRRMYRHHKVNRMTAKAKRVVGDLFAQFMEAPNLLPEGWRREAESAGADETARARVIADYIAGMTDRYAIEEHHTLFEVFTITT